jgi:CDP-glycerol glycerophosphotransferase (TagB/SpsB family)
MTVTGDEYAKTYAKTFGLRDDQMLVTGYPKVDYIFHPVENWKEKLTIPKAGKYIFWLPTFRNTCTPGMERHNHTSPKGASGLPIIETISQLEQLDDFLGKNDAALVIKLHPFQDRSLICNMSNYDNICLVENSEFLKEDIQINQILGYADALISDYSSAAVDYLVTDRPVGFTLDDIDTYEKERGFFWDNVKEMLPGCELYTYNDMFEFIKDVLAGNDPGWEKRQSLSEQMQKYKDDKNSARVFEAFNIRR